MKIVPVIAYEEPCYPTAAYLELHPELLRYVPRRWRNHPSIVAALAMVCALLAQRDCHGEAKTNSPRSVAPKGANIASLPQASSKTAPIFKHGDGHGSFGCIAVAAPTFLSEEEARQVIVDEARKAGLAFKADAKELKGVPLPVTDQYAFLADLRAGKKNHKSPPTSKGALWLDGTDPSKQISYEYVSRQDFQDWEHKDGTTMCSVSAYNLLEAAETLQQGLAQTAPNERVAVFYDPMTYVKTPTGKKTTQLAWKEAQQKAVTESKEQLRRQVRDFIAWLKAQGVI